MPYNFSEVHFNIETAPNCLIFGRFTGFPNTEYEFAIHRKRDDSLFAKPENGKIKTDANGHYDEPIPGPRLGDEGPVIQVLVYARYRKIGDPDFRNDVPVVIYYRCDL